MQAKKLAGPEAGSQKYDILTALGCHALGCPPGIQRLILRFLTLVTARYNWRQGVLHVGQREIARLWSVDERTVKREMGKLRALGWITVESPARRGRVASYALDLTAIRAATRDAWAKVGSDYEARMCGTHESPPASATVVSFPRPEALAECVSHGVPPESVQGWSEVQAILRAEDAAVYAAWFDALRCGSGAGEGLTLLAPSAFHASYVRTHYSDRLVRALRRSGGTGEFRIVAVP
jgi:hypothetical protein